MSPPVKVAYVQPGNAGNHTLNILTPSGEYKKLHDYAVAPAWSADGKTIAFFGEPGITKLGGIYEQDAGIWLMDTQGKNVRQLLRVEYVENMVWSRKNNKLAFEVAPPDINPTIWVLDPNRDKYEPDSPDIYRFPGRQPTWSPDGQKLIINRACISECGLWLVNYDGGNPQPIITNNNNLNLDATNVSYPAWSPLDDLTFTYQESDGNFEIYLYNLDSDQIRNLTDRPNTDITPVFSPDGQQIYLRTDHYGGGENWKITVINRATGTNSQGSNERIVIEWAGGSHEKWGWVRPSVH